MAQVTETCSRCGSESTFSIPDVDEHDGTRIFWECPQQLEGITCGARNMIDGDDPAVAAVAAAAIAEPDVSHVVDGENLTGGDLIS
jgi:hypothetical protein